jgi:hypothetical protein
MKSRPKLYGENEKRESVPSKVRPAIRRILEQIATEDDRTLSNTVEHLLAESPRVKKRLAAEVGVG